MRRTQNENRWKLGHGFGFFIGRVRIANRVIWNNRNESRRKAVENMATKHWRPAGRTWIFNDFVSPSFAYFIDSNERKLGPAGRTRSQLNQTMDRLGARMITRDLAQDFEGPGW